MFGLHTLMRLVIEPGDQVLGLRFRAGVGLDPAPNVDASSQ